MTVDAVEELSKGAEQLLWRPISQLSLPMRLPKPTEDLLFIEGLEREALKLLVSEALPELWDGVTKANQAGRTLVERVEDLVSKAWVWSREREL